MKSTAMLLTLLTLSGAPGTASAQERAERPRKTPTPLKIQVVFARYQGEKKVSSVPYTLSLNADDRPSRVRMGIQVPIQVAVQPPQPGPIAYRDVGNNLDCSAESLDDGRFKLGCTFEQSSLYSTDVDRRASGSAIGDVPVSSVPLIRNFRSEANLLLRDGQSATYVAATDPVSGEVLKIDLTLNVVK